MVARQDLGIASGSVPVAIWSGVEVVQSHRITSSVEGITKPGVVA